MLLVICTTKRAIVSMYGSLHLWQPLSGDDRPRSPSESWRKQVVAQGTHCVVWGDGGYPWCHGGGQPLQCYDDIPCRMPGWPYYCTGHVVYSLHIISWPSVVLILGKRYRRWTNNKYKLDQRLMFAVVPNYAVLQTVQRNAVCSVV